MPVADHGKSPVWFVFHCPNKLQSWPIGLRKIFIDYFFFQDDQWDCTKNRFLIDLLPLKNVSERSLPSVALKHWNFINFETLDTASWNIKLYWNQHFLNGSSESWNTGYTLELLFNPIKRIVQPDQANLELLHCHLSTPCLNIVFVKPKKINKQAERDSAAKKEKCVTRQNVIRVAAKCNTNARCNNIDAKCNKIFNAECNNLSTQIVITFLTHNVITQNVIISE